MLAKRNSAIKKPGSSVVSDLHYATTTNFKNFSKHLKNSEEFSKVSNLEKYIFAIYPPTFREMGFFVQPTSAP